MFEKAYSMITGGKLDILVNNANFNSAGMIQNLTKEDIRISTEAPYGIQVNGVAPGVMLHSRLRGYFENPSDDPRMVAVRKNIVDSALECNLKRVSIPQEVANTVAFLCTDACSYISGQMIMNGGGVTAP